MSSRYVRATSSKRGRRFVSGGRPYADAAARSSAYTKRGYVARGSVRMSHFMTRSPSEPGYVDVAANDYPMITTGSVTLLNTIPQGAGTSQRVGKRVALKSLQLRGKSKSQAATLTAHCAFMIVYDKRPTGVLPAVTDILVTADPEAMNNDTNSGRFRILKRVERVFCGADTGTTITAAGAYVESFYMNLKGLPQVFKAAGTGAIGDIEEGALYLVCVGSGPTTYGGDLDCQFRLRYVDV